MRNRLIDRIVAYEAKAQMFSYTPLNQLSNDQLLDWLEELAVEIFCMNSGDTTPNATEYD